ncbi:MAG: response regulator [Bdellovibrionales bacterium]|nr:response regulator [Bdellovibrionales bacterium]
MKVLIVDPDTTRLRTIRSILANLGYKAADVDSENDGESALNSVKRKKYDIVFTCTKLPRMDGIALVSEIKKDKPAVSVIVYSSEPSKEEVVASIKAGASSYFVHPCSVSDIEDSLKRAVGKSKV